MRSSCCGFFEAFGQVKKAISVIKNRHAVPESTIRELEFGNGTIQIGEPLTRFQGVLTGAPRFMGDERELLRSTQNA